MFKTPQITTFEKAHNESNSTQENGRKNNRAKAVIYFNSEKQTPEEESAAILFALSGKHKILNRSRVSEDAGFVGRNGERVDEEEDECDRFKQVVHAKRRLSSKFNRNYGDDRGVRVGVAAVENGASVNATDDDDDEAAVEEEGPPIRAKKGMKTPTEFFLSSAQQTNDCDKNSNKKKTKSNNDRNKEDIDVERVKVSGVRNDRLEILENIMVRANAPIGWISYAREMVRGEDLVLSLLSNARDDADDAYVTMNDKNKRKKKMKSNNKKKKNNNNKNESSDNDEDNDDDNDNDNDNDGDFKIDSAVKRARTIKGVTQVAAQANSLCLETNASAAWLECIAADAHDRARQVRRTTNRSEKMRKSILMSKKKLQNNNTGHDNNNNIASFAAAEVSNLALANILANWELHLSEQIGVSCTVLNDLETIAERVLLLVANDDNNDNDNETTTTEFSIEKLEHSTVKRDKEVSILAKGMQDRAEKVAARALL